MSVGPLERARRAALALAIGLCVVIARAELALASPLLELVGDTGAAGALQARTAGGGSAAAYFNPALLTEAAPGATVGFFLLREQIRLSLDGRPAGSFQVPEGIENARRASGERFPIYPIPTRSLQLGREASPTQAALLARPRQGSGSGYDTRGYLVAGVVVSLFDDHLALAFHGVLPRGEFTRMRAFFNDEREQYFSNSLHPELYADRLLSVSMALGAGLKLTEALSLGAGATFALATTTAARAYVADAGNLGELLLDVDAPVALGIAPHFGARYRLSERLRLTGSFHGSQRVELDASYTFLLPNAIEEASSLRFSLHYLPWRLALGAAHELVQGSDQSLTLVGTALYASWSSYRDRHGERPAAPYRWSDTVSPALGLRYRLHRLSTALDVTYAPSPVPKQTGRSNYVDNDRLGACLGAELGVTVRGTRLKLGLQAQAHHLVPRYQRKLPTPTRPDGEAVRLERVRDELPDDALLSGQPVAGAAGLQTNNPGWPGFESSGWVVAAGLYLSAEL